MIPLGKIILEMLFMLKDYIEIDSLGPGLGRYFDRQSALYG
ncbi:hypothetical protein D1BOALGB6SA_5299 [Olavius sp. associated proteobacterium Delta 1]|nr:hypothetical protein D1BOALGB6SA_5299 [Olavius sp. associated proteobacterium Delta 1]